MDQDFFFFLQETGSVLLTQNNVVKPATGSQLRLVFTFSHFSCMSSSIQTEANKIYSRPVNLTILHWKLVLEQMLTF